MFTLLIYLKVAGIDVKCLFMRILEIKNPFVMHVVKIDIASSLNSQVQELPNVMGK
jgi:hypothetical protein